MSNESPRFSAGVNHQKLVKNPVQEDIPTAAGAVANLHVYPLSKLNDSALPGYLTLTQRVLMFLEGMR